VTLSKIRSENVVAIHESVSGSLLFSSSSMTEFHRHISYTKLPVVEEPKYGAAGVSLQTIVEEIKAELNPANRVRIPPRKFRPYSI
jgi:hypothetical protein